MSFQLRCYTCCNFPYPDTEQMRPVWISSGSFLFGMQFARFARKSSPVSFPQFFTKCLFLVSLVDLPLLKSQSWLILLGSLQYSLLLSREILNFQASGPWFYSAVFSTATEINIINGVALLKRFKNMCFYGVKLTVSLTECVFKILSFLNPINSWSFMPHHLV